MRGADLIAEYLLKEKVPYILGYAGHGAIGLLDAIYDRTDRIRHISPRIEQTAGFMADVYYRLTHQPLAVYASTGPGPMNTMIAVANAFYDCSAFLMITGQVPTTQFDSGALQDDYRFHGDVSSMYTPIVKKSWRIRKIEDLCKALPDAFSLMRTGRPGPVHLDMPYDLYIKTAPVEVPEPVKPSALPNWRTPASDEAAERALDTLVNAQRPLILAGGGVRVGEALQELRTLAEYLEIPVYTSFMGKGALPSDHPLHLGCRRGLGRISGNRSGAQRRCHPGARRALQRSAHRLVAAGLRLQYPADAAHTGRYRCRGDRPQLSGRDGHRRGRQELPGPALENCSGQAAPAKLQQLLAPGDRKLQDRLAQFHQAVRDQQRSADRTAPDDGRHGQDLARRYGDGG
jgi:hypothetical protein